MEYARNVLGIADADSAENDPASPHAVVTPVYCALPRAAGGPPALHDNDAIRLVRGSRLHAICASDEIVEGYFCNYEMNPDYLARFEAAGLVPVGYGAGGQIRAVEIPGHRFFIATLFHPQLSSTPDRPHPLVRALVTAASEAKLAG